MADTERNRTANGIWNDANWDTTKPDADDTGDMNGKSVVCDTTESCARVIGSAASSVLDISGVAAVLTCNLTSAANIVATPNFKLKMTGSGNKNTPSKLILNHEINFSSAAAQMVDIQGTAAQFDIVNLLADVVIAGLNLTSTRMRSNSATVTAFASGSIIDYMMFDSLGYTSAYLLQIQNHDIARKLLTLGNIIFKSCGATSYGIGVNAILSGDWLFDGGSNGAGVGGVNCNQILSSCNFYDDGSIRTITIRNNLSAKYQIAATTFFGLIKLVLTNIYMATTSLLATSIFKDSSWLYARSCSVKYWLTTEVIADYAKIDIQNAYGAESVLAFSDTIIQTRESIKYENTDNADFTFANGAASLDIYDLWIKTTGAVNMLKSVKGSCFLQSGRTRKIRFASTPSSLNHYGDVLSAPQYEPFIHIMGDTGTDTDWRISYGMMPNAVNRDLIMETSGFTWNAATAGGTLADAGTIIFKTTSIRYDYNLGAWVNMDVAVQSLATLAVDVTGTLAGLGTWAFKLSDDDGTTWADDWMTLAEVQANWFVVGGITKVVDKYKKMQLQMRVTNSTGVAKTVTGMLASAIIVDVALESARTINSDFDEVKAALAVVDGNVDDIETAVAALPTSQEVRDAMKLAPTAGAPAAGSVDEHLDNGATSAALAVVDGLVDSLVAQTVYVSSAGNDANAGTIGLPVLTVEQATLIAPKGSVIKIVKGVVLVCKIPGVPVTIDGYIIEGAGGTINQAEYNYVQNCTLKNLKWGYAGGSGQGLIFDGTMNMDNCDLSGCADSMFGSANLKLHSVSTTFEYIKDLGLNTADISFINCNIRRLTTTGTHSRMVMKKVSFHEAVVMNCGDGIFEDCTGNGAFAITGNDNVLRNIQATAVTATGTGNVVVNNEQWAKEATATTNTTTITTAISTATATIVAAIAGVSAAVLTAAQVTAACVAALNKKVPDSPTQDSPYDILKMLRRNFLTIKEDLFTKLDTHYNNLSRKK